MHRIRVLFVLPTLQGGGAERVIITLLRHLDRSRFEVHLALIRKEGPYLRDVPPDVQVHKLAGSRVRHSIPSIIRLVRRLRPKAALSALGELNLAMALSRPFLPRDVRLLLQEVIFASTQLIETSRHPGMWRRFYHYLYPRADRIICMSDAMLDDLATYFGIPRSKMVRVYSPVDIVRIRELAAADESPYFGPGPQIVAAGRLHKQKGFDLLLDAMAIVARAIPSARLTILGQGELESDLKARANRLGLSPAVHFAGFQVNPYPYFRHADVFVLSSRYEGLGLVVAEALAVGTPVVVVDSPGGAPEVIEGCPIGRLVPKADAGLLAEAITEVLRSESASHRVEGVEACLDRFRVERVVREYEEILSAPGRRQ